MKADSKSFLVVQCGVALIALGLIVSAACLYLYRRADQQRGKVRESVTHSPADWRKEASLAARRAAEEHRYQEARSILEGAVAQEPQNLRLRKELVDVLFWQDETDDALDAIAEGRREFFSRSYDEQLDDEALFYLTCLTETHATIMLNQDDLSRAAEDGEEIISLDPRDWRGYRILASVAERKGELRRARDYLIEAKRRDPGNDSEMERLIERILKAEEAGELD